MIRAVVTFLTLLLLWVLAAQANHVLSTWHVYLFLGGLYVTYAALRLPLLGGYATVFAAGLLCDANAASETWFGTHAWLFAVAFAVIYSLRDRLARDETIIRVVVALIANLGLFLAFSFIQVAASPALGSAWPRLFLDLACSQVALVVVAPWFFALQRRSLEFARSESISLG